MGTLQKQMQAHTSQGRLPRNVWGEKGKKNDFLEKFHCVKAKKTRKRQDLMKTLMRLLMRFWSEEAGRLSALFLHGDGRRGHSQKERRASMWVGMGWEGQRRAGRESAVPAFLIRTEMLYNDKGQQGPPPSPHMQSTRGSGCPASLTHTETTRCSF